MPRKHLSHLFSALPFESKLVFIGSLALLVSVFMPWYEDIDAFHMGDMFLGVTGPLYMVGFVLLLISGLTLYTAVSDKKIEKLPLEKPHLNLLVGISSLFLLVLTASVYFHTKFGVNITMKEMRFGMIAAFIGASLVALGGFLENKKNHSGFDTLEGKIEPLITISKEDRIPGEIRPHEETRRREESKLYEEEDKQIHL